MHVLSRLNYRFLAAISSVVARSRREDGQTFVEYALILAVIGVGTAAALTVLKDQVTALYGQIITDVPW